MTARHRPRTSQEEKHPPEPYSEGLDWSRPLARRRLLGAMGASGAVLAGAPLLAACGSSSSAKVGFALATYVVPRYVHLDLPDFTKAAAAEGYQTVSLQANSDVTTQFNDVQSLLADDVAALCVMPVNSDQSPALVRLAQSKKVPVVAYNQVVSDKAVAAYVARDNHEVGVMMAEGAKAFLGSLKGNFVIASGQAGDAVAAGITAGYMTVLQPAIKSGAVKIISQQYNAGWDPASAQSQVEDALTLAHDNVQAVLANNDGLAGGAIQALKAKGLAGKVYVCGLDATNEGCRAILLGQMAFSVFTKYDVMGRIAGQLCSELAKGQRISVLRTYPVPGGNIPFFPIDSYVITKVNMVPYLKKYSPVYTSPEQVVQGVPEKDWPAGMAALLG